jgi:peptidyl-dipeptidase A
MSVQADGSDVRTLNNLTRSHHWTGVLLHELGHALAAEYADRSLPQRLVLWPNGIIAETESQTIDRIANDARWLHEVVGIGAGRADRLADEMRQRARLSQLILTRWSLVQAHFELALHRDPEQNLRALWWDLVERFQMIPRPEGRDEPDWAAKIHNANFPGHYYVYILGELVVSQLNRALVEQVGGLYGHAQAGPFLRDRLYRLGARHDWEETARRATGAPLAVDAYVQEWFAAD